VVERVTTVTAKLFLFEAALFAPCEVRFLDERIPGVIVAINTDDGTVDVATEEAFFDHLPRWAFGSNPMEMHWQWPDAPEPTDPKTFRPNRYRDKKTGKFRKFPDKEPPRDPTPPRAA
jgi:hypothetical protein